MIPYENSYFGSTFCYANKQKIDKKCCDFCGLLVTYAGLPQWVDSRGRFLLLLLLTPGPGLLFGSLLLLLTGGNISARIVAQWVFV